MLSDPCSMGRFGTLLLHLALDFGTFEGAGRLVVELSVVWDRLGRRWKLRWSECHHRKRNNKCVCGSKETFLGEQVWRSCDFFFFFPHLVIFLYFFLYCDSVSEWIKVTRKNRQYAFSLLCYALCNTVQENPCNVTHSVYLWIGSECKYYLKAFMPRGVFYVLYLLMMVYWNY